MTMAEMLRVHGEIEVRDSKRWEEAKAMKEIKGYYRRASKYGSVWVVTITDEDAMLAVNQNKMTGFGVEDAKHRFNEILAWAGYKITEVERDIIPDGVGC